MPWTVHLQNADPIESGIASFRVKHEAVNFRREKCIEISPLTISHFWEIREHQTWRQRELHRLTVSALADRSYKPLPPIWLTLLNRIPQGTFDPLQENFPLAYHYPHIADSDPTKIAYTPSEEYGALDKQKVVRPGKYLLDHINPVLTGTLDQVAIDQLIAALTLKPVTRIDSHFHLTTDPKEIMNVYIHGPESCMAYETRRYKSKPIHPTEVYGDSPDLALAYMTNDDDRVVARSIVWPAKQVFVRIYADDDVQHDSFQNALNDRGFFRGTLAGAKVRRLECDYGIVMPYIDGSVASCDEYKENYMILRESNGGEYQAENTNGLAECPRECSNCGDYYNNPDSDFCESCEDNHWTCESCSAESFDLDESYRHDFQILCESCYDEATTLTCEHCDNTWRDDELPLSMRRKVNSLNDRFCIDCVNDNVGDCENCGSTDSRNNDNLCENCEATNETD